MQGNGFKVGLAIFFVVLSFYYLWPSAQSVYHNNKMDKLDDATAIASATRGSAPSGASARRPG